MISRSKISSLLLIVFILGLTKLPTIEARWFLDDHDITEQNWPALITRNDIFEKPIIRKSGFKTGEEIQTGISILEATKCGKSANNLKEAAAAQKTPNLLEFPWMALLVYFDGSTKTLDCDGSLISDRYVLTAAHCIRLENKTLVSVRLGEYNTMKDDDCTGNKIKRKCAPPVQEIDVEEAIYHEDYDPTSISFTDDIGLVRLKTKAIFRSNVMPICLPITHQSKVATKNWMFTAGWNRSEKDDRSNLPFKAVVPIIDSKTCEGIHIFIDLNEKHMCVGRDNVINSYCNGDSGTPIFNTAPYAYGGKPRFVQYGIVSLYGSFCNSMLPNLYVKLEPYIPWVAGNIRY